MNRSALHQPTRWLLLVALAAAACSSPSPPGPSADGESHITPEQLAAIDFGSDDYASLWVDGEWYYVRPDGTSMPVIAWDNGPDPFSEGLARTRRDGKIGYFDESFEMVIPPKYDFGWPFEDGRARVCLGCGPEADPDGEHAADEHTAIVGGLWGYIDRDGVEVVPVGPSEGDG